MMNSLLIAIWMLAATPGAEAQPSPPASLPSSFRSATRGKGEPDRTTLETATKPQTVKARSGSELRDAVQDALRRWARPGEKDLRPAAGEFMAMYVELQHDKQLSPSAREELRAKVRRRLLDIAAQLRTRSAETVTVPGERGLPLAQRGQNPPVNGAMSPGGVGQNDNGADLADLIQQVVAPQTWEANGGRGTIRYWPPHQAMIIRQTQDVHDEIGEVLLQLRRAGQ